MRVAGVAFYAHWSVPVVVLLCLVAPHVVGRLMSVVVTPVSIVVLGYVFIIVVHELGHALAARCSGVAVLSLTLSAMGGLCGHATPKSYVPAFMVAAGGVLAQMTLLLGSLAWLGPMGGAHTAAALPVKLLFVYVNTAIAIANLLPLKRRDDPLGTDGYVLWQIAARRWKGEPFAYPDTSRTFPPDTRLALIPEFAPGNFTSGIEILNDNTTPMDFVADALEKHLGLPRKEALRLMVAAHVEGGVLVPLPPARAQAVADAIANEAQAAGHVLVCRVALAAAPG